MANSEASLAATAKRAATYAGIVSAVVAFGMIFLTTTMAPWFSWPANALSDLGNPDRWAQFWIYNWGLLIAGTLGLVFVVRTAVESKNLAHWAASLVLAISMFDLALVGWFHAGRVHHGLVSTVFFVSLTYGVMLYGTGEVLEGEQYRGLALIWLGLLHVTQWALWDLIDVGNGVAIPEFVGAIVLAIWMGVATSQLTDWTLPGGRGGVGAKKL